MLKRSIIIIGLIVLLAIAIYPVSSLVKEQMDKQNQYVPTVGEYQAEKCRSMLQEAKDKYEKEAPPNEVSRQPLDPIKEITAPRYKKTDDGVYDNAEAKDSGEAVLMFTGDIMCRYEQQDAAIKKYGEPDFSDSFVYMKDIFDDADLVAGNLETTISESTKYTLEENITEDLPNRNAPSTYLDAVRDSGIDLVMTCNNHCLDGGVRSIYETIFHLDQYGLMHTGTFLNAEDRADHPFVMADVNGIRVAFVSYSEWFNSHDGGLTEEGRNCLINKYDADKVKDDIASAKAAGAEYVIVYTHIGKEYSHDATEKQMKEIREAAEAGADLVVNLHPHVVQKTGSIETDDGRTVPFSYCLGNFISSMEENDRRETAVLKLSLKKDGDIVQMTDLTYIPCYTLPEYEGNVYTVVPLVPERVRDNEELTEEVRSIRKYIGGHIPCEYSYRNGRH